MTGIYKDFDISLDGTPSDYIFGDHMGILVTSVKYLSGGSVVSPTVGDVAFQWSYDNVTWNVFSGGVYRLPDGMSGACVNSSIRYIRAIGSVEGADQIRVSLRFDNDGFAGIPQTAQSSNRYFSAVNTVQVDGFQQSVLQGNALGASTFITVPANKTHSVKMVSNTDTVVAYVYAEGLNISFKDGVASGNLVELAGGGKLNTLEDFDFQTCIEVYDAEATGKRVVTQKDALSTPVVINGGGAFDLINNTDSSVQTYLSVGQVGLSEPKAPFILTPETQLTPTTEMSDYNG